MFPHPKNGVNEKSTVHARTHVYINTHMYTQRLSHTQTLTPTQTDIQRHTHTHLNLSVYYDHDYECCYFYYIIILSITKCTKKFTYLMLCQLVPFFGRSAPPAYYQTKPRMLILHQFMNLDRDKRILFGHCRTCPLVKISQ